MLKNGTCLIADCVVPTFTNPNNLSIVTGAPPAVHGICGNYFFDPEHRRGSDDERPEVPARRHDPRGVRATPARAVAVVTAKDKLRGCWHGHDWRGGICFSSEKADQASMAENGIDDVAALVGMPVPSVYSAELSEFVFAAGVKLLERDRPDIMYLSTTDYVQHKHAPGTPDGQRLLRDDGPLPGEARRAAARRIVLTADHGMNAKTDADGQPDVIYLQDVLDGWLGKDTARVILPITDPYVVHHGALGSFATVYLPSATPQTSARDSSRRCPASKLVLAARRGGAALRAAAPTASATSSSSPTSSRCSAPAASRHDLSGLDAPLRSHGGISEQRVPLIFNRTARRLRPTAGAGATSTPSTSPSTTLPERHACMDTMIRDRCATNICASPARRSDRRARSRCAIPYTGVVGTVPSATVDDVRARSQIAHAYKPKLTRYER